MDKPGCVVCGSHERSLYTQKHGHTIYTCHACDLKYVDPIPGSSEVYSEDYFAGAEKGFGYVDYDKDKEPMVPTFDEYLERIESLTNAEHPKLLDVGAATGFFLDLAKKRGFDVHGVEISSFAAAQGREKGLDVRSGTLADLGREESYDVITLLDVIEHVSDPRVELKRVYEHLSAEGLLVINTPDAGSLYARAMGARWHLIVPPEHLYYFNRNNMVRLLEDEGFDVLVVSTIGKKFTPQYIFKMLYMWQKLGIWRWLSSLSNRRPFSGMWIPINLRDNMFVIARKQL
jgi:2-polyprenyl-3-methyl-5-hydroxy-6-metoxy-1,4-benzoquinol methylase